MAVGVIAKCHNPDLGGKAGYLRVATVTFKNNSTSRHMTVSAMGFTADGKPLLMK